MLRVKRKRNSSIKNIDNLNHLCYSVRMMGGDDIVEIKEKKDRMEVLMSDMRLAICIGMSSLLLTTATLILVVVIVCR